MATNPTTNAITLVSKAFVRAHSGHSALIPWKAFFQRGARSPRNQRIRTRGILSTKTMADIRAPVPSFPSKSHSSRYVRSPRIDSRSRSSWREKESVEKNA